MKTTLSFAALLLAFFSFGQGQFQKEAAGNLEHASGQIMMLAEAIPESDYQWTPQEGVRSVKEVLIHTISANYFFSTKFGGAIPESVNLKTLETDLKSKEQIIEALTQSSNVLIAAVRKTKDKSLTEKVEFPFPGEYTQMTAILIALSHNHEHMGQLIAYARSNEITPPWSKGEM